MISVEDVSAQGRGGELSLSPLSLPLPLPLPRPALSTSLDLSRVSEPDREGTAG